MLSVNYIDDCFVRCFQSLKKTILSYAEIESLRKDIVASLGAVTSTYVQSTNNKEKESVYKSIFQEFNACLDITNTREMTVDWIYQGEPDCFTAWRYTGTEFLAGKCPFASLKTKEATIRKHLKAHMEKIEKLFYSVR